MTSKSPKATRKSRQNPWYKNQVSSLDGRHVRLSDKVRALKAFANSTEESLKETQQELAFAMEAIRGLIVEVQLLQGTKVVEWSPPKSPNSISKEAK